ncbi:MAG: hypothetical protein ACFE0Q_11400 [Anaerolineae bacterium]
MTKQRDDGENLAMAFYVYAAQLIKEGKSRQQVIDTLMERGISHENAETIVTRLNQSRDNVTRRSGYRHLAFGSAIILLSLLPLFGVFVEPVTGFSAIVAIIVLASGVLIAWRGVMRVYVTR